MTGIAGRYELVVNGLGKICEYTEFVKEGMSLPKESRQCNQ